MTQEEFVKHACEQVMRFTKIKCWNDLSEATKVQLGFNMGAMALGLSLTKEDGFLALANLREEKISVEDFRNHISKIIKSNHEVDERNVNRYF